MNENNSYEKSRHYCMRDVNPSGTCPMIGTCCAIPSTPYHPSYRHYRVRCYRTKQQMLELMLSSLTEEPPVMIVIKPTPPPVRIIRG